MPKAMPKLRNADINVSDYTTLIPPNALIQDIPAGRAAEKTVRDCRQTITDIFEAAAAGRKHPIVVIVGPCSIFDIEAARKYSDMLADLAKKVAPEIVLVMRTYFEKPRTKGGWRGVIYDPHLSGEEKINEGLHIARGLLKYNADKGLPSATEFLDLNIPQHIGDLISCGFIGARSLDPVHQWLASGLSMPTGVKNNTAGNVEVAANAILVSRQPCAFPGIDMDGRAAIVHTRGNPHTFLVLRGGDSGPNYDSPSVENALSLLLHKELEPHKPLEPAIMVDCSHGNSGKDYRKQPGVFENVIGQIVNGNTGIMGLMLESNIKEGKQDIPEDLHGFDRSALDTEKSITDSCIGWEETERLIMLAYGLLAARRD